MQEPVNTSKKGNWIKMAIALIALIAAVIGYLSLSTKSPAPDVTFTSITGEKITTQSLRGKVVMVNFWATWCPPCIEELPLIDAFYVANQSKSLQVLGLAVDQPSMVRRYLGQKPLNFPIGLAGYSGTALGQSLGNQQNVLPYSLLFDANGMLLKQKAGKLEQSDLDAWLRSVI